jgi:hypothetical protein
MVNGGMVDRWIGLAMGPRRAEFMIEVLHNDSLLCMGPQTLLHT